MDIKLNLLKEIKSSETSLFNKQITNVLKKELNYLINPLQLLESGE